MNTRETYDTAGLRALQNAYDLAIAQRGVGPSGDSSGSAKNDALAKAIIEVANHSELSVTELASQAAALVAQRQYSSSRQLAPHAGYVPMTDVNLFWSEMALILAVWFSLVYVLPH